PLYTLSLHDALPILIEPRKTAGDLVHRTAPPANPRLVGVVHVRHADALNLRRSADVGARAVERIHEERTHRMDVPLLNPVLAERLLLHELELLLAQPELLTRKLQLLLAHLSLRPTREEVAQEAERRRHPNCNGEWLCHGLVLTKKPRPPRQGARLGLCLCCRSYSAASCALASASRLSSILFCTIVTTAPPVATVQIRSPTITKVLPPSPTNRDMAVSTAAITSAHVLPVHTLCANQPQIPIVTARR